MCAFVISAVVRPELILCLFAEYGFILIKYVNVNSALFCSETTPALYPCHGFRTWCLCKLSVRFPVDGS